MSGANNPRLSALRIARPGEWRRRVRQALESAGSVPAAARALGVGTRTLVRWLAEVPELRAGLELPAPRGASAKPLENEGSEEKEGEPQKER